MAKWPLGLDLERLSVRVEREQLAQVEAIALATHQHLSPVIRQLLQEALDARAVRQRLLGGPSFDADGSPMAGGK